MAPISAAPGPAAGRPTPPGGRRSPRGRPPARRQGDADAVLRPLGPSERWYWIADHVTPYNCITRVRVDGRLGPESVRTALARLQHRHPLLRAAVRTDARGRPVFVRAPGRAVPLRTGTLHDPERQWQDDINERQIPDRVDIRRGPGLRATLLSTPDGLQHDLLLSVSHVICDGSSALALLRECVELAAWAQRPEDHQQPHLPPLVLRESVDGLIPAAHRLRRPAELLRTVRSIALDQRRLRERTPTRVTGRRKVPFAERRSGFLHHRLPPEQVAELRRRCRAERTTVHGALSAAMVVAAVRHSRDLFGQAHDERSGPLRITLGTPVNLRGQLEPALPEYEMGAFVSMLRTHVDYHGDLTFWELARSVTDDLSDRRKRAEEFCMLHLSARMVPGSLWRGLRMMKTMEEGSPQNFCLSNVGRVDFPTAAGALRLSGVQTAASLGASCYIGATVNTSGGEMGMSLNYLREAIPEEVAAGFAAEWVDVLATRLSAGEPRPPSP